MAITYVGAGAVQNGTNPTIPVPSGYAAGDLLVIVTTGTVVNIPTPPTGWVVAGYSGAGPSFQVYYKFAAASESSVSLTNGQSGATAVMVAYRGVTSFDAIGAFAQSGTTSIATSSVTTRSDNDYVLSIYVGSQTSSTWTAPGSTTNRVQYNSNVTNRGLLIVDEAQAGAGPSTSRTASVSAAQQLNCVSFAISPSIKTVVLTTTGASTYTIPADFSSFVSVEVIGGGGGSRGSNSASTVSSAGGGGGAYSKTTGITGLTAGATTYVSIGAGGTAGTSTPGNGGTGGDTWFNKTTNAAPTLTSDGALAKGGVGSSGTASAAGGASASGVGTTKYSGGASGAAGSGVNSKAGGAGGGAGGPSGSGGAGGGPGTASTPGGGAGGGGANAGGPGSAGGSSAAAGAGGTNVFGALGGAAGTSGSLPGVAGVNGGGGGGGYGASNGATGGAGAQGGVQNVWIASGTTTTYGPGAGSGGAGSGQLGSTALGAAGVNYGAGASASASQITAAGFAGGQGILVFTYIATSPDVTVSVTGVSGTTALGTETVSTGATTSVTGVYGTTNLGTANEYGNAQLNVTGVVGTGVVGNVNVDINPTIVDVTGVQAQFYLNLVNVWGDINDTQNANWAQINDAQNPGWTSVNSLQT